MDSHGLQRGGMGRGGAEGSAPLDRLLADLYSEARGRDALTSHADLSRSCSLRGRLRNHLPRVFRIEKMRAPVRVAGDGGRTFNAQVGGGGSMHVDEQRIEGWSRFWSFYVPIGPWLEGRTSRPHRDIRWSGILRNILDSWRNVLSNLT